MDIEKLWSRMEAARKAHDGARDAYHAALIDAYHFRVGDIIISTKGALARVDAVFVQYGDVRHTAVMQKKNGSFGEKTVPMWRDEWQAAVLHRREESQEREAAPSPKGEAPQ